MNAIQALGWALLHFVWQATLVAGALWLLLRAARSHPATTRYAIGVGGMAVLFALPIGTAFYAAHSTSTASALATGVDRNLAASPSPHSVGGGDPGRVAPAPDQPVAARIASVPTDRASKLRTAAQPARLVQVFDRGLPWLVGAWFVGVLLLAGKLLGGWIVAQRLRQRTRQASSACRAQLLRLADRMQIRRTVEVLESNLIDVPVVVGWLRPVILMPASVIAGLTARQVELLLAHELAHVRRHDYLVNLLQSLVETLLFYHPAVWWVSRRVREERENCCDDLVVEACGDATLYAQTLFGIERLRGLESKLVPAASGGALLGRVRRLVEPRGRRAEPFPRWQAGVLALGALIAVATGARLSGAAVLPIASGRPHLAPASDGSQPEPHASHAVIATTGDSESSEDPGKQDPAPRRPDRASVERGKPSSIEQASDESRPLGERWKWARSRARDAGWSQYWIGYRIQPPQWLHGGLYAARLEGEDALFSDDVVLQGRLVHIGEIGGFEAPGAPLPASLGAPEDIGLLFEFTRQDLVRVHIASLVYPVNLRNAPLVWLGSSTDGESIPVVHDLYRAARSQDARVDLVGALGVHDSPAVVPILREILQGNGPVDARAEAAEWLGRHPDSNGLAALARAARQDRSADVRREAAESTGEMSLPAATDSAIALAYTLRDSDARREAVESLGAKTDARSLAALVEIAREPDGGSGAGREAAESLGARPDGSGIDALLALARTHADPDVQREAVETLGEALAPERAAKVLVEIANSDTSVDAQREAVETLSQLPDGRGLRDVERLAREHRDPEVRREAVESLGESLPAAKALSILDDIAQNDPSVDVQREAVETLAHLENLHGMGRVEEMARVHPHPDVRREALESLAQIAPERALPVLKKLVDEESSPDLRSNALETLAALEGGLGIPALIDIARSHPDPEVRREAIRALAESDEPEARKFLERALGRN